MTVARRPSGTASGRRARWVLAIALTLGLAMGVPAAPPAGADESDEAQIRVEITDVSPDVLTEDATVTLRGTVTNLAAHAWEDVNAYMVIPSTPFRSRTQLEELGDEPIEVFGGRRIVELDYLETIGTLQAGDSTDFEITVPYDALGIDGSEGVYPVGVHILGTPPDGERDIDGVARAYTYVPKIDDTRPVETSIVWPFTNPLHRDANGDYEGLSDFIDDLSNGGRLREYLSLAEEDADRDTTVLIDPSLLVTLREIAENRIGPPSSPREVGLAEEDRQIARDYLDDLLELADRTTLWVLCFGRPDVSGFDNDSSESADLIETIRTATTEAMNEFELTGRRVIWPAGGLASEPTLETSRADGDMPVILSPDSLPDWEPRHGSVLRVGTEAGPLPVLVNDPAYAGGRSDSTAVKRQLLLSQTAMAVLDQRTHADSDAGVVVVMDPQWVPSATQGSVYEALDAPWVEPAPVESRWIDDPPTFAGAAGAESAAPGMTEDQMSAVYEANDLMALQNQIVEPTDVAYHRRQIPEMVRVMWRTNTMAGEEFSSAVLGHLRGEVSNIRIAGPRQVTLSGSGGRVPITVSNDLDIAVTVGVRLRAQDSAVGFSEVETLEIGAGQRTTLTMDVDLQDRVGATVIAEVTTPEGDPLGQATSFNVRTSQFGTYLWVAIVVAGGLFVVALGRRLVARARSGNGDD